MMIIIIIYNIIKIIYPSIYLSLYIRIYIYIYYIYICKVYIYIYIYIYIYTYIQKLTKHYGLSKNNITNDNERSSDNKSVR